MIQGQVPIVVVVRGWLWDPSSRLTSGDLIRFPEKLKAKMLESGGPEPQVLQYQWSRVPKDLPAESARFTSWAFGLTSERHAGCVSFVGHSAGAAMVFKAASRGVAMGYMGTLGLPTVGASKPRSVQVWANFYTNTHIDDVAGTLWAAKMPADINHNLKRRHSEFWDSDAAVEVSAAQISEAWARCVEAARKAPGGGVGHGSS